MDYATLERATSGRARCRGCRRVIGVGECRLRLGWESGARYFHPPCAVPAEWNQLEAAAALPDAPTLSSDILDAIERQRAARTAQWTAESAAEALLSPRPAAECLPVTETCLYCKHAVAAGVIAVVDQRGVLHPACVSAWLDTGAVDVDRWERALAENSGDELRQIEHHWQ